MQNINDTCNNCGKIGHIFSQCKAPINSFGIIVFTNSDSNGNGGNGNRNGNDGPLYIMIRRKDSFGYIDFIRGKYSPYNMNQLQKMFNEMSVEEKKRLQNFPPYTFHSLWNNMWGITTTFSSLSSSLLSPIRCQQQQQSIMEDVREHKEFNQYKTPTLSNTQISSSIGVDSVSEVREKHINSTLPMVKKQPIQPIQPIVNNEYGTNWGGQSYNNSYNNSNNSNSKYSNGLNKQYKNEE